MVLSLPFASSAILLLLTAGILLTTLEFNRPGLILPGAAGLLATLLAVASVLRETNGRVVLCSLALAALFLAADFRRPRLFGAIAGGVLLLAAYVILARQSDSTASLIIALVCAPLVAVTTGVLARIAHRARVNKGLD